MIDKIKSNEPLYRAIRTFIQTFIGAILSAITISGIDELDKKAVLSLLASALSAALSAVMNLKKTEPNQIETESEQIEIESDAE